MVVNIPDQVQSPVSTVSTNFYMYPCPFSFAVLLDSLSLSSISTKSESDEELEEKLHPYNSYF